MSDLRDFVLNFCREMGGLVEPPAYGVYPLLWPDELAERLGVEAYQKLTFDEVVVSAEAADITRLYYGHPLIERIIEEVRRRPVWNYLAVPAVRLEKRGLADLAGSAISLGNARLQVIPKTAEQITLNHYLRFNFKASLVTDEKQERLVSVLMHVQGGYPLPNQAELTQATPLVPADPALLSLPVAPLAWTPPPQPAQTLPASPPLSLAVLTGLLERAKAGAVRELAEPLANLHRRALRHLELDRARLEQYYADLQSDLERRLSRASEERRPALADKLAAVQAERQSKLLDAQAKYELRLVLELINLAVIAQPKVTLPVQIENRHASITRTVAWDPLLHRLEPLVCDACGQPGYELFLCTTGHLAHKECLAPQCVDCKRVYCQTCRDSVKSCVICDRPVCVRSLRQCPTCGRGTCQEHIGLCHAAEGQPLRQVLPAAQPASPPPAPPVQAAPAKARTKPAPAVKARPARPTPPTPRVTGQKIEVYLETTAPVITAYVIAAGRELAARTWELTPDGLAVWCKCEKGSWCPSNRIVKRPETADRIESQMQAEINALRQEYQVAGNRVSFYQILNNVPRPERRLLLRGRWKHADALVAARAGFDQGLKSQSR
jgi:hypothetical protein